MTRGNQREVDRARAQARAAKFSKQTAKGSGGARLAKMAEDAEKMREKLKRKEMIKQGLIVEEKPKKEFDTSYL